MEAEKLLPCPFCGGEAVAKNYVIEAQVCCLGCKARMTRSHGAHDDNGLPESIEAWNNRPALAAQSAEIEAMKPDAERYRLLRACADDCGLMISFCLPGDYTDFVDVQQDYKAGDSLDKAIDAARQAAGGSRD